MKLNGSLEYLQMKVDDITVKAFNLKVTICGCWWLKFDVVDIFWMLVFQASGLTKLPHHMEGLTKLSHQAYVKGTSGSSGFVWPKLSKPSPTPRLQYRCNRSYFVSLTVYLFTIILKMLNYVNWPIVNDKVSYLW